MLLSEKVVQSNCTVHIKICYQSVELGIAYLRAMVHVCVMHPYVLILINYMSYVGQPLLVPQQVPSNTVANTQQPVKEFKLVVHNNTLSHQPNEPHEVSAFVEKVQSRSRMLTITYVSFVVDLILGCCLLSLNLVTILGAAVATWFYYFAGAILAILSLILFLSAIPMLIVGLTGTLLVSKGRATNIETSIQKYSYSFEKVSIEPNPQFKTIVFTLK